VTVLVTTVAGDGTRGRRSARRSWSLRGLAVVASAATICLGLVAPGGAAAATRGASATPHFAKVGTHYSVQKHLCAAPKAGHAACFAIRRVAASKSTPGAEPYSVKAAIPVGPSGGLTPSDLTTAYGLDPSGGAGQTVAVVDAYDDPNALSDLNTFDTEYSLPAETATSFIKVGQTGSTTVLPAADTTGWSGEESLDVDAVRAVCHGCNIILVETDDSSDDNLSAGVQAAVALHATEISNSYGGPEPAAKSVTPAQAKAYEKLYNHPGVVITASTGDDGWFTWDDALEPAPSAEAPNIPASLPTVVSVGGTFLSLNADATRSSESVWNDNGVAASNNAPGNSGLGATGGGCSVLYKADGWQSNVAGYSKTGCGTQRLAADISADADPNSGIDTYSSYDCGTDCEVNGVVPGWETVGGTSLSSPLIAAMWALAGGSGQVAYPALSLYGHSTSASAFYDVTKGGNSWCDGASSAVCSATTQSETGVTGNPNDLSLGGVNLGTVDCGFKSGTKSVTAVANDHQCYAATGYDGPSGLGTPNGVTAFKALSPKAKILIKGSAQAKHKTLFRVGGSDPFPGATWVTAVWTWGDGHKSTGATVSHTYKKAGHYTVSIVATDSYGRVSTASGSLTVSH
jgi:hypothetical protein